MKLIQFQCVTVQNMNDESHIKKWISAVAHHMHLSPSKLALNAGLAASTVTRYLNDTTGTVTIRQDTLGKLSKYSGVPFMQLPTETSKIIVRSKSELKTYNPKDIDLPSWYHAAIEAAIKGQEDVEVFILYSDALNLAGCCPGDAVIIKRTRRPKPDDIVLARVFYGESENVLRIYEPPFLISHSSTQKPQRPLTVDENLVSITGVAIGSIRFLNSRLGFSQDKG